MDRPSEPITAGIEALAFLTGQWVGENDADRIEEWWTEPHAGQMLGMFRWHRDGNPRFYELLDASSADEGLVFRIKHFGPTLAGWEERDEAVTLDLVAAGRNQAVFLKRGEARWMVYHRDEDELRAWFETEATPHDPDDDFVYRRA